MSRGDEEMCIRFCREFHVSEVFSCQKGGVWKLFLGLALLVKRYPGRLIRVTSQKMFCAGTGLKVDLLFCSTLGLHHLSVSLSQAFFCHFMTIDDTPVQLQDH